MKINIGFLGALALLFIGLKLGGVIAWPWLWVLAPVWIPPALVLLVAAGFFLLACIVAGVSIAGAYIHDLHRNQ